jgi:hypothetical protein
MSEGPENPFQSPLSSGEALPRSSRVRRIAGLGAYLAAAFASFIGAGSFLALVYIRFHRHFFARDRVLFEGLFAYLFAVALAWSGHRLRVRTHGKAEWTILLLIFLFMAAWSAIDLVKQLRSAGDFLGILISD